MCSRILKIAVLVSGGGTNLQSLIDAMNSNYFSSKIELVISNKKDAYGLVRAEKAGIKAIFINENNELLKCLEDNKIDLIVLAGYLKILDNNLLDKYKNRIINIHPSLLPKYGGLGMYGLHVHKAVFNASEKESGATVHFVTEEVDGGEIIIQKSVNIEDCNSPEEIQKKVLKIEHSILKEAVRLIEKGDLNEKSIS